MIVFIYISFYFVDAVRQNETAASWWQNSSSESHMFNIHNYTVYWLLRAVKVITRMYIFYRRQMWVVLPCSALSRWIRDQLRTNTESLCTQQVKLPQINRLGRKMLHSDRLSFPLAGSMFGESLFLPAGIDMNFSSQILSYFSCSFYTELGKLASNETLL